jgi:hAT family C-terminal dimerisation region
MEPTNFNVTKIDSYFEQLVDYVCTLYEHHINQLQLDKVAENNRDDESTDTEKSIVEEEKQEEIVDDHMLSLFQQMIDNDRNNRSETTDDPDKSARDFRHQIESMVQDYRKYCTPMQIESWLKEYGNDAYHKECQNNPKRLQHRITVMKDPEYTSKFFEVLSWWRIEGSIKFKELSVVANIILGKPTHNGFQERVFSRGVYLDGKLKKRLKEGNFEMSVLNSFNGKRVSDIKVSLQEKKTKDFCGWLEEKQTEENQAKEIMLFFKKQKDQKKDEMTVDMDSDTDENDDVDTDNDDDSLTDFLTSKNFLERKETETVKDSGTSTGTSTSAQLKNSGDIIIEV